MRTAIIRFVRLVKYISAIYIHNHTYIYIYTIIYTSRTDPEGLGLSNDKHPGGRETARAF